MGQHREIAETKERSGAHAMSFTVPRARASRSRTSHASQLPRSVSCHDSPSHVSASRPSVAPQKSIKCCCLFAETGRQNCKRGVGVPTEVTPNCNQIAYNHALHFIHIGHRPRSLHFARPGHPPVRVRARAPGHALLILTRAVTHARSR